MMQLSRSQARTVRVTCAASFLLFSACSFGTTAKGPGEVLSHTRHGARALKLAERKSNSGNTANALNVAGNSSSEAFENQVLAFGAKPGSPSTPEGNEARSEYKPIPPEIVRYLELFSREQRGVIVEHSKCSKSVSPEVLEILSANGVPEEILSIAFLESRFNPSIRNPSGETVGMWQLAKATARQYGLVVNQKRDERKDPMKATAAAARMLSELRDQFGSWPLALAAYNSGPYRVAQAIRESGGERSVFTLAARGLLSQTTSDYLARFAALTLILGDPGKYGFPEGNTADS